MTFVSQGRGNKTRQPEFHSVHIQDPLACLLILLELEVIVEYNSIFFLSSQLSRQISF